MKMTREQALAEIQKLKKALPILKERLPLSMEIPSQGKITMTYDEAKALIEEMEMLLSIHPKIH